MGMDNTASSKQDSGGDVAYRILSAETWVRGTVRCHVPVTRRRTYHVQLFHSRHHYFSFSSIFFLSLPLVVALLVTMVKGLFGGLKGVDAFGKVCT